MSTNTDSRLTLPFRDPRVPAVDQPSRCQPVRTDRVVDAMEITLSDRPQLERNYPHWELTREIVQAIVEVHRHLGPGLLESTYRICLVDELERRGLRVATEVPIAVSYKGRRLDGGYRADLVVDDRVIVELKCVDGLEPIHSAQVLSYLRLTGLAVGLLVNFHSVVVRKSIRRFVLSPT